jgi:uncharacterized protein (DUF2236 family)
MWKINREMVLLLAGGRALLMQLAHPKVAAGVAAHSGFDSDPLGRLQRTMSSMWSIIFDDREQAQTVLRNIAAVHGRVQGRVPCGEASSGKSYRALDLVLLLWVHATLIDSDLAGYDLFVARLTEAQRRGYYADSIKLARLFGIDDARIPNTLGAFEHYLAEQLNNGEIVAGNTATRLAHSILYPRPRVLRPAGPVFRLLTAGLLPEILRRSYGFEWNEKRRQRYVLASSTIRALRPLVPAPLCIVPNARTAERSLERNSARHGGLGRRLFERSSTEQRG